MGLNISQQVDSNHYFVLGNGQVVKSMKELIELLPDINDTLFTYHANNQKNDFVNWIAHVTGDKEISNTRFDAEDKAQFLSQLQSYLGQSSQVAVTNNISQDVPRVTMDDNKDEDIPIDLPPDLPPDAFEDDDETKDSEQVPLQKPSDQEQQNGVQSEAGKTEENEPEPSPESDKDANAQPTKEDSKQEEKSEESEISEETKEKPAEPEQLEKSQDTKQNTETVEEIIKEELKTESPKNELMMTSFGVKYLDSLFSNGIPAKCNILFVGEMNTQKTQTAFRIMLSAASRGQNALYISFHDSEEKIVRILSTLYKDTKAYISAGNIVIKKLDPFAIVKHQKEIINAAEDFSFVKDLQPSTVIVDSLSALELCFGDEKAAYREYVDSMFKFFEMLSLISIYIKDIRSVEDIHKEFYENLLSDIMIQFSEDKGLMLKVVKEYPIKSASFKKGIFSFLHRK